METIPTAITRNLVRLRFVVVPVNSQRDAAYRRFLRPTFKKLLLNNGTVGQIGSTSKQVAPVSPPSPPFWCKIVCDDGASPISQTKERMFHFRFCLHSNQIVTFDIFKAMSELEVRGLALVFFMGLGDYLFSTPLLAALRRQFPELAIHAYVSNNSDSYNSPLVRGLLQQDPNVDGVEYYDGKPSSYSNFDWRNYDYSDVFDRVPEGFLVIPMIYEHGGRARHRVLSLFDTFSLPRPPTVPRPIIHAPPRTNARIDELLAAVLAAHRINRQGIVFLQLEARSSNYTFPYADELATRLVRLGYVVVSVTPLAVLDDAIVLVDTSKLSISDSIRLLKLIHEAAGKDLTLLTITSVFGSVSAALGIRNLQMWHFDDPGMHALWYPNIHLIAPKDNPAIPQNNITVATESDYSLNRCRQADYRPDFIIATLLSVFHAREVDSSDESKRRPELLRLVDNNFAPM